MTETDQQPRIVSLYAQRNQIRADIYAAIEQVRVQNDRLTELRQALAAVDADICRTWDGAGLLPRGRPGYCSLYSNSGDEPNTTRGPRTTSSTLSARVETPTPCRCPFP